jgi:RNA polymerase sigma-70 factor, ECF subfamily
MSGTFSVTGMSNIVMAEEQNTSDDRSLAEACTRGDAAAFEVLVLRHQRMIFNVALRMTGNYEDSADIVQNAFIAAWSKIGEYQGEARFSTWLTAIVVNLSRNRIRQRTVSQQRMAYSLDTPLPNGTGEMPPDPPDKAPSALEQLEEAELRQMVQHCIKKLDQVFREVLVLRDMQEMSYEEVGAALNLREGTVKSRLFRARDAVKDCLKRVLDRP